MIVKYSNIFNTCSAILHSISMNYLCDMATNSCVLCIDIFTTFGAILYSIVGTVCMM